MKEELEKVCQQHGAKMNQMREEHRMEIADAKRS
jgi:hypothetical protein